MKTHQALYPVTPVDRTAQRFGVYPAVPKLGQGLQNATGLDIG